MATHPLTREQVQSVVDEYLKPKVLPEAVAALEADGFYMTEDLVRPTSEFLTDLLRSATGKEVAHMATPPEAPIDVYYLVESERIDIRTLRLIAEERAVSRMYLRRP